MKVKTTNGQILDVGIAHPLGGTQIEWVAFDANDLRNIMRTDKATQIFDSLRCRMVPLDLSEASLDDDVQLLAERFTENAFTVKTKCS